MIFKPNIHPRKDVDTWKNKKYCATEENALKDPILVTVCFNKHATLDGDV